MKEVETKFATISIVGKPNAGKSTLLNKLIGYRISIVTPKVQTTRSMIRGIVVHDNAQLVFIDTPGIFEPKKNLEKAMVRAAWSSLSGTDFVMFIIDSRYGIDDGQKTILSRIKDHTDNIIVLLNKIDLLCNDVVDTLYDTITSLAPHVHIFKISAVNGKGVNKLLSFLVENSSKSPWMYDKDDITNAPMRFLASEITREKLFLELQEELPYNLTVDTEAWEEKSDGSVKIQQVIIVQRESHKRIILGKNGGMIKQIGQKSRMDIKKYLGIEAHLFLFVKVRENWDVQLCKDIAR